MFVIVVIFVYLICVGFLRYKIIASCANFCMHARMFIFEYLALMSLMLFMNLTVKYTKEHFNAFLPPWTLL